MRKALHRYVRNFACLLLVYCFYSPSFSQTVNIDSVVNRYYKVIEEIPSKAAVRVNTVSGIIPSYHAMIIQMKGAGIITPALPSDPTFGDTTSLNGAGNYEINVICGVRGDTVFMVNDLINTYTVAGKVQLVQFAEYISANVTDTLRATPWNNTTGTGGVIALFVEDTLTLNAPIWADTAGFAGGIFKQSSSTCSNGLTSYVYNPTSGTQNGAYKGEGVADVATTSNGGRGAPANGGGGGNNHNNSGGGGANLNAGGRGGGNSSTTSCNASANHKGEGGKALSNWSGRKIFLGGGGGSGHNNNGVYNFGGGNGGGIIFIHAGTLTGNNDTISANGEIGGMSQADGAGGGGAGGTIIMDVNNYDGNVKIKATGGTGGTSDDAVNLNICYGGGGGGGGGAIYFTGDLPSIAMTVDSGLAGPEIRRHDPSCATIQPASPGRKGQVFSNYVYRRSSVLATYCATVLPVHLIFFEAKASDKKTILKWKIANAETPDHFIIERMEENGRWLQIISLPANILKEEYNATDNDPVPGYNLYRLRIIEKNGAITYSTVQRVFIDGGYKTFTIYPNPANNKIIIDGDFNSATEMKLSDVSGKILLTRKIINRQTEIALPPLSNGIYFINIDQTVRKLVIQD